MKLEKQVKKVIFLAICMIFSACETWKPSEIYEFSPHDCTWFDAETLVEIKCDDPILKEKYMMIPIDDYAEFKTEYVCKKRKEEKDEKN